MPYKKIIIKKESAQGTAVEKSTLWKVNNNQQHDDVLERIKEKINEPCGAGQFCDRGDCCSYKFQDILEIIESAQQSVKAHE